MLSANPGTGGLQATGCPRPTCRCTLRVQPRTASPRFFHSRSDGPAWLMV